MMARIFFEILIVCIFVNAAPSSSDGLKTNVNYDDVKINNELFSTSNHHKDHNENNRRKRMFNYFQGFPPLNPNTYPDYPKTDNYNTGVFNYEDPYLQIYKRLLGISSAIRQPPPPVYNHPILYPVIFIPQVSCACPTSTDQLKTNGKNNTMPDVDNRVNMEDERQNWGLVINETIVEDDGDGSRPISFEPIPPRRPMSRPPPPVEHGSIQGDINAVTTTTTSRPITDNLAQNPTNEITNCDDAILNCCHKPQITYECFTEQRCDPATYSENPCNPDLVLRVVYKFLDFYQRRVG